MSPSLNGQQMQEIVSSLLLLCGTGEEEQKAACVINFLPDILISSLRPDIDGSNEHKQTF